MRKLFSQSKKWLSVVLTAILLLTMLTPLNASANTIGITEPKPVGETILSNVGSLTLGETPLANITFSLYNTETNVWYDLTSNINGYFTYSLPNGTYKIDGVWVDPTWYVLGKTFTVTNGLVDGQPLTIDALDYQIPTDNTANVLGTVQNGTQPLSHLAFSIHSTDGIWYDTKTDKNGQFAFELPDGSYVVDGIWDSASGKWYELNQAFTVTDGNLQGSTELLIDIASVASNNVSGTLTKGSDALSDLTFSVRTVSGDEKWYSATTDANGNYSLRLPDGDYLLEGIWNNSESKWYVLNKTFTVAGALQLDINVYTDGPTDLTPNLTGVLKKGNEALPNVVFSVHTTSGEETWYDISSDENGHFSTLLPNGSYMLEGIWLESENKWYELKQEFTVDGAYELNIDVLAGQPPVGDVTAPTVTLVSNIDNDFSKNFSEMDQVNLLFSEEIAEASRAAIEAEIEGMTDLFGQGVRASWVGSENNQLAITIFSDTFSLTKDSSFTISKANVSDLAGNLPQEDLIVEIPDYFSLTGDVKLPSDNPTTTSLIVRFGGTLHDDTKAITDVANIIRNSQITRIVDGTEIPVPVTAIQWNADYSELTLTIPETTFTNREFVDVLFVNVKEAQTGRPLGGIMGMITFNEQTPPPGDTNAPIVTNLSKTAVTIGESLTATSNKDGYLYLIPSYYGGSLSSLNAAVAEGSGLKVSAVAGQPANIITAGLSQGLYVIYAVDSNNQLSSPSELINLTQGTDPMLGNISFHITTGNSITPMTGSYASVQLAPIKGGSSHVSSVNANVSLESNVLKVDVSNININQATTYYALINTNGYLLMQKFTAAELATGAVKNILVDEKYAPIDVTVAGKEKAPSERMILNVMNESGRSIFNTFVFSGLKIPFGTYNFQYTSTNIDASYNLFKDSFTVSETNHIVNFTEADLAKVTVNTDNMTQANYVLDGMGPLYNIGTKYNTIYHSNINEGVKQVYLTKGLYQNIITTYSFEKDQNQWDISIDTNPIDLLGDHTLIVDDQFDINLDWKSGYSTKEITAYRWLMDYFKVPIKNQNGQMLNAIYKTTTGRETLNGKITLKAAGKTYTKTVNGLRFIYLSINDITGGEAVTGQVELIFEVEGAPFAITPYSEIVTIK